MSFFGLPGHWLTRTLDGWLGEDERVRHIRAALSIGASVAFLFSIFNLLTEGMALLGLIELGVVFGLLVPALAISGSARWGRYAISLLLLASAVVFGALIVIGGVEGTGIYWVYTVPFLAFFMVGQRRGWWYCLVFLGLVAIYLLWLNPVFPQTYQYSLTVRVHFLLSFLFYILVASAFKHVRVRFEQKLLLEKKTAQSAMEAKSRFLAAASHDLRQPAHALGMFVERLTQLPHDDTTKELVDGVNASVRALQVMLDAFFDYSRLDSKYVQYRKIAFPISDLFDQLEVAFAAMAEKKAIGLRVRPSSAWATGDPVLLYRVLLNLVHNAVQYTHRGNVLVSCRQSRDGKQLKLQIWDSGIGISAENQSKIFQEFFQVENEARDRSKGIGLGLSIVNKTCTLFGWPLALRSELGQGSRFTVLVPASGVRSRAATAEQSVDAPVRELQALNVLLVEDDDLSGTAVATLLASWGCHVMLSTDAYDAVDKVATGPVPDFIVSDYRLPKGKNGIEAVAMVRAAAGRNIAACIVSGDPDAGLGRQVTDAGLVLLQKPVRPAKLRSVLRNQVAR